MRNIFSIEDILPNWAKWKIKTVDFILNNIRFLRIGRANKIGRKFNHLRNSDFAEAAMKDLGLSITLNGKENMPLTGAVTIVANHPGGADVLSTAAVIGRVRKDFTILANKLVCFYLIDDIVISVDTLSRKKVDNAEIHAAYKAGKVVVFYAAGKNSRYDKDGLLRDRRWRTTFLDFAREYNTPINVLKIEGANSPLFYKVSNFRQKYKSLAKIPLENMFQLREIIEAEKKLDMYLSKPIYFEDENKQETKQEKRAIADRLYKFLYTMKDNNLDFEHYEESAKSRASIG